ncbi:MAG: ankyrin repeat protein [Bacteriovoracaceae bacterium]|jgi:ankyrin repeat protein
MKTLSFIIILIFLFSCKKEEKTPRNPVSEEVMNKAKQASKALDLHDYKKANDLLEEIEPSKEEKEMTDGLVKKYGKANILLWTSAPTGDLESVRNALEGGADVNLNIEGHGGPLLGATHSGNIKLVSYLLDKGADPNTRNLSGMTPLSIAVSADRLDLVKLLLKHKATFNRGGDPNNQNFSILTVALSTRKMDMFNYLLKAGADPNGANGLPLAFSIMLKNKDAIESLIKNGADINYPGKGGFRPLMTAVVEGDREIIELLINLGANPKLKDDNGLDVYAWAKKHNSKGGKILKELLTKRATHKN